MRSRLLALAALVACAGPRPHPPRGDLALTVSGKVEDGPFTFGVDDLREAHRRAFTGTPPGGPAARFEGAVVPDLLDDAVDLDRAADLAVFRGEGGRAAAVPLPVLRQIRPVLADSVDGARAGAGARPPAARLQLAWPTSEQPGIETDPRLAGWWVAGVDRVEVMRWADTYGRALEVPVGGSDAARRGASAVGESCLACHALRGAGATSAAPLDTPGAASDPVGFTVRLRSHLARLPASPAGRGRPAPPWAVEDVTAFLAAVERSPRPARPAMTRP